MAVKWKECETIRIEVRTMENRKTRGAQNARDAKNDRNLVSQTSCMEYHV